MIKVVIDLRDKDNVKFFNDVIKVVGDMLVEKMQEQLEEKDAIATGYLYNSFDVKVSEALSGEVVNEAPYSLVLEVGAKPHRPPYDEILEWVQIKKHEGGEEAVKAAWRIVKKIEKEGYEGRFYARDALREVVSDGRKL